MVSLACPMSPPLVAISPLWPITAAADSGFRRRVFCLLIFVALAASPLPADQRPPVWGQWPSWGDQGDGTYRNPVLPGDYSDLDAIRVGSDYYAISSTLQLSPGLLVLHSKDLVNWSILGHAVDDLTRIGPDLNWDRMNRYGRGVWAGAIRHHAGRFWIYFFTPDEGLFMTGSANPAGPWDPLHRMRTGSGWDDCCPFWDDDGQGYLVASNFSDDYKIHLFKLSADGRELAPDWDVVIHQSPGSEANKLYKINGTYYHYYSEVKAEGRVPMMGRAKNIIGPYERRQLLHVDKATDQEPNQGGLVQTEAGDWFFFTHHGTGSWEGRAASLLPVTWIDGWPIIGRPAPDGIGTMVWSGRKPVPGGPVVTPQSDDEFSLPVLAPQWEWNHQPRADQWSLVERPGFLRLHAFRPLQPDDLLKVGNILSQRSMRTAENVAIVKMELAGMADGQRAGLLHFSTRGMAALGIRQSGTERALFLRAGDKVTSGPAITATSIWLRSAWGMDGVSRFFYSLDGVAFEAFGEPCQMVWGAYRGDRIGLFSYNNAMDAGYVDFDWFHYSYAGPASARPARSVSTPKLPQ